MIKKFNVTDYKRVQFLPDQTIPFMLYIVQYDDPSYMYAEEIGRFDFYNNEGKLAVPGHGMKEYKRFSALLNTFYKYDECFGWNSKVVDDCKKAGTSKRASDKKELKQKEIEFQTNKATEYINSLKNKDQKTLGYLKEFKDFDDNKLMEIIERSFKNVISQQLINNVLQAIKEAIIVINEQIELEQNKISEVEEVKNITVFNAYGQTFPTWIEAHDYCIKNNLDYLYIEEVSTSTEATEQIENNSITTENNNSYIVANRNFETYSEALQYCNESDFDPETMIQIKGAGTSQPLSDSITADNSNNITDSQPELFYLYKNTFTTYNEAYNHAITNMIPVTMIISNKHSYMTNERLQQLEKEYVFSKSNMSITDIKEYYNYISELPITLDQENRYYKLKSYIQRHEYRQQQKEQREREQKEKALQINKMLMDLYSIGMTKKEYSSLVTYYLNNEKIYSWFSGISTEKMYSELLEVYNSHYKQPATV